MLTATCHDGPCRTPALWSPAASSGRHRARVLISVKAPRSAPAGGAHGLDAGSAHARPDWPLPTMPAPTLPPAVRMYGNLLKSSNLRVCGRLVPLGVPLLVNRTPVDPVSRSRTALGWRDHVLSLWRPRKAPAGPVLNCGAHPSLARGHLLLWQAATPCGTVLA